MAAVAQAGPYRRALNFMDRKRTAVQRQLSRSGLAGYEPLTQAALMAIAHRAPEGSAVYDVGAHIGLYANLIDAVYGRRLSVYAFEPAPDTSRICADIRDANGLGFELVRSAVSDAPGSAELYLSLKSESCNSLNAFCRPYTQSVTVPVTTLDDFTQERPALRPHLIKLNVETLEGKALAGSLRTVQEHRPWIVLEVLPRSDHKSLEQSLRAVTELGYELHPIQAETPWIRRYPENYHTHVSHCGRDWLLAPEPLTYDFHHTMRTWLRAILECDERTNVELLEGAAFPRRWNAPYSSFLPSRGHSLKGLVRGQRA
ncbi:FkbM family methyltransferase [Streptomyces fractus]|uniref:FkbM family methyltransferase n=1 Tax=Streptomyces fractus TaxID=641806 RepID=UPI003CF0C2D7